MPRSANVCPRNRVRYRDLFLETLESIKRDGAEVVRLVELANNQVVRYRMETGERGPDSVLGRCQTLYEKAAILTRQHPRELFSGMRVLDDHRREADR